MENYFKELKFVCNLVKKAGSEILKIYNSEFSYELKEDKSPITLADLKSNEILIEGLKENFDYEIVSEEVESEILNEEGRVWVIDPLDGTRDFVQKTDEFSIMVALLDAGKPVLGVVYVPALDKLYFATKGFGSFLKIGNSDPIKLEVSNEDNLNNFTLVRSRNHFSEADEKISGSLKINDFKKMGSVGIKFGDISQGNSHLCYYTTSNMGIWDDCSSHIILKEAGGDVFTIDGEEPSYDLKTKKMPRGFIGTNGKNKAKILEVIQNVIK